MLSDILVRIYPNARAEYISSLTSREGQDLLARHGIAETPLRLCHFLAQCAHETGSFAITHESGNYSAERLRIIFKKYFSPEEAKDYARKPKAVLSRAYANRLGNGPEATGDGWNYRGRGLLQETGRSNYSHRSQAAGVDLVANPDAAADPVVSLRIALHRWTESKLNSYADKGPNEAAILAVSRGINLGNPQAIGKPNGLADRQKHFLRLWDALKGIEMSELKTEKIAEGTLAATGKASQAHKDGELEYFLSFEQQERLAELLNRRVNVPLIFNEEDEKAIFIKIVQSIDRNIYKYTPKEITDAAKDKNKSISKEVSEALKNYVVDFLVDTIPLLFLPKSVKRWLIQDAINVIIAAMLDKTEIDESIDRFLSELLDEPSEVAEAA